MLSKFASQRKVKENLPAVRLSLPLERATGLAELPLGAMYMVYGLSNSGKTSLILEVALCAQRSGIIPIFIISENKLDWNRARKWGIDLSEEKCLIRDDFLSLEDAYDFIGVIVKSVKTGELDSDVIIFWDSVSNFHSREGFEISKTGEIIKKYTNQKDANTIGFYNPIISNMITSTKYSDVPHSVGLFYVAQAYELPLAYPPGAKILTPNGGEKIWYPISVSFRMKEKKTISAVIKGREVHYGTVSSIEIDKNHLTDYSMEGDIFILPDKIIVPDKQELQEYIKQKRGEWGISVELIEKLCEFDSGIEE